MNRSIVYRLAIIGTFLVLSGCSVQTATPQPEKYPPDDEVIANALNSTYKWANQPINLNNGFFQKTGDRPLLCKVLGVPQPVGDLDIGGGTARGTALGLVANTGGTGNFLFVVANYTTDGKKYTGTNSVGFGDRNRIKSIAIENGDIVVDYLVRKHGEGAAAKPTVPVTSVLAIRNDTLMAKRSIGYLADAGGNQGTLDDLQKDGRIIVKEHSFPAELENCGKVRFLSTDYRPFHAFDFFLTDEKGNIIYSFPGKYRSGWQHSAIRAVSLADVNRDGLTDVIIITEYVPVPGSKEVGPDPYASIYFQKRTGFVDDLDFDRQLNETRQNTDIRTVLEFAKGKTPQL